MSAENPNLLLVKSIVGIYLNRSLPEQNGRLKQLIKNIFDDLKMPADTLGEGGEGEIMRALRSTLDWITDASLTHKLSIADVRERIIMDTAFAADYCDVIERLLKIDMEDKEEVTERIEGIYCELAHSYQKIKFAATVAKAHRQLNFSNEHFEFKTLASALEEQIRDISSSSNTMHEGFGGKVDFDDLDSIEETFKAAQEALSTEGVLKTGLQGLNKLWGIGGYIRGGSYLYGALTHNYKTGILLDHCRWMCMHNKPHLLDKEKKPMILRVSFENKPEQDLPIMYRCLWEAEHGKKCDLKEVDSREAAKYIKDRMTKNGFKFEMLCFDPNNMDVWDLITILEGYEAEGYEIHAVIVDYLELITKKQTGSIQRRQDEVINLTVEILRNHCFPRSITQINAHQLSTEAGTLAREGTSNFAKKVAPGHYWQNSKSLATKVDGAAVMHIHKIDTESYLTFAWAKNRTHSETPESHKAFAQKFEQHGGIVDDIYEEKSTAIYTWASVSDPVNDTAAESDEAW